MGSRTVVVDDWEPSSDGTKCSIPVGLIGADSEPVRRGDLITVRYGGKRQSIWTGKVTMTRKGMVHLRRYDSIESNADRGYSDTIRDDASSTEYAVRDDIEFKPSHDENVDGTSLPEKSRHEYEDEYDDVVGSNDGVVAGAVRKVLNGLVTLCSNVCSNVSYWFRHLGFVRRLKYRRQRADRGWSDRDLWMAGDFVLKRTADMLEEFARTTIGYPDPYPMESRLVRHDEDYEDWLASNAASDIGCIRLFPDDGGWKATVKDVGEDYCAWLQDLYHASLVIRDYMERHSIDGRYTVYAREREAYGPEEWERREAMSDAEFMRTWNWIGENINGIVM